MKFTTESVTSTPAILKRKLGGELLVPITVTESATVVKAGSPIDASGKIANDANAVGILLNDVYVAENPNGSLIKGFACINESVAEAHCGLTYAEAMKSALTNIDFE